MVKANAPQSDRRLNYNIKRTAKRDLEKLEKQRAIEVPAGYRETYNVKRREKALKAKLEPANLVPPTAEQIEAKKAFNLKAKIKYNMLPLEERTRKLSTLQKLNKKARRKVVAQGRQLENQQLLLDAMETDKNRIYIQNKSLRPLLSTPEADIIQYMIGPLGNMDSAEVDQMDPILRQATFMQLHRINDMFTDKLKAERKRGLHTDDRSAFVIRHFHRVTQSFSDGAINGALDLFAKKSFRDDSGAFSKIALTTALSAQSFMSCNKNGLQIVADAVNRNEASGEGMMVSRNTIQECGNQIATGTKTIVAPTIDEDHRVYRVDLITELKNITSLEFLQRTQQLPTDLVISHLDHSYESDPAWNGCIVRVDTSNAYLMAEVKRLAIDVNYSCDGFELASTSNGGVGFILTFKGKETLSRLNKDYDKQKDNPEFGDRAGCHSINSVLFQGLAIGPDNFEMSRRLTEASFKIIQEMHRPGILFYNPETKLYYSFKNSITVDKKEGNQLTVTGGGSYMTKFFDIYTDDNQETRGIQTWRQCDRCFIKGRRIFGDHWNRFSHHTHNFEGYVQLCKTFSSAYRDCQMQAAVKKRGASNGPRISLVKSKDRAFKAEKKSKILEDPIYDPLDNDVGPCHHRDVIGEEERKYWRNLPLDDWKRSTVFKGLSLNVREDRAAIKTALLDLFEASVEDVDECSKNQKAMHTYWSDQIEKKYVPMSKVMSLNETALPQKGQKSDRYKLEANERIHGIHADDPMTTQRLVDLSIEMNLISADVFAAIPSAFEKRKLILLFAKFIGNRIEYCNIERERTPIVTRIEMLIPCGLHNNIRIPSNLLTNLRKEINKREDLTAVQKKALGERLEQTINESIGSGTNANFNYTYKGSLLQVVSLSGVKLVQVMDNWAALVEVVFADLDDPVSIEHKSKWCDLGHRFVDCMYLLNYKYDMTTEQDISRFQLCIDLFCSCYRDLLGINSETNYIQNMSAGVFSYFMSAYGSIYAYNNTAMEACAGREQDFFQKGTQHDVDGHRGKSLIEAFMDRHMIGRTILMDKLAPGTLKKTVDTGKIIRNQERNLKLKAKKIAIHAMQVDGINIVENRKIRVVQKDELGKRKCNYIFLKVGDRVPTPASRVINKKRKLQTKIVKILESKQTNEVFI